MDENSHTRRRIITYVIVAGGLLLSYVLLRTSSWQGNTQLHTVMEVVATLLALFVGIVALVRFHTRPNNTFLFIGTGFLGTAFLDGYHAVVTSSFFDHLFPSAPASLIPWSWIASRFFLSLLLFLSWWAWRKEEKLGDAGKVGKQMVYTMAGLLTLGSFLCFAFAPLPRAYYPELFFGRPEEFVPGLFFLLATCAVPESDREAVDGVLGVDLGIKELATDGDGDHFSGEGVEAKRLWYCERRAALQSVGTPSAKRRLKTLSGRERRFRRDINHQISKRLVEKAKDTGRAIALEDLGGIRDRVTVRKSQRARHHSWSFFQLRSFIEYKAKRAGVPLVLVDPRNTSRRCSVCGHCEKKNRKTQSEFVCRSCGHSMNADVNAALNIGAKGAFNLPMVSSIAA